MPIKREQAVISVDLGGSKILSAVIGAQGTIIARDLRPTEARRGVEVVFRNVLDSVSAAVIKAELSLKPAALGICVPSIANSNAGIVYHPSNLPGWENVPLGNMLQKATGLKTFVMNDANAAALGELYFGAAIGIRNCVYVTISTGIGGGIIIDGKLYEGHTGLAGEVGHMVVEPHGIPCGCGSSGCWERYASGSAIALKAKTAVNAGKKTNLLKLAGGNVEKIDANLIHAAALQGDKLAKELIAESARYLAIGFGNLINIFNPQMIIVGGGYARMGKVLLQPAFKLAARYSFPEAFAANRFRLAKLGGNSGIRGTAAYVFNELADTRN